jgi:hypothetical protein
VVGILLVFSRGIYGLSVSRRRRRCRCTTATAHDPCRPFPCPRRINAVETTPVVWCGVELQRLLCVARDVAEAGLERWLISCAGRVPTPHPHDGGMGRWHRVPKTFLQKTVYQKLIGTVHHVDVLYMG